MTGKIPAKSCIMNACICSADACAAMGRVGPTVIFSVGFHDNVKKPPTVDGVEIVATVIFAPLPDPIVSVSRIILSDTS